MADIVQLDSFRSPERVVVSLPLRAGSKIRIIETGEECSVAYFIDGRATCCLDGRYVTLQPGQWSRVP